MNGQQNRIVVYLPQSMLAEIHSEAKRQDRSISYLVRRAIRHSMPALKRLPSSSTGERSTQ